MITRLVGPMLALVTRGSARMCRPNHFVAAMHNSAIQNRPKNVSPIAPSNIFSALYKRATGRPLPATVEPLAVTLLADCSQSVDFPLFFSELGLEDSFQSWFLVTELHVWMLSVRLMAEGEDGKALRNALVRLLWHDCEQRAKLIGGLSPSERKKQLNELGEAFQATLFIYDDGLCGSDRDMANALWRRMFANEESAAQHPERLELLVAYVRRTVAALDSVDFLQLATKGVRWFPLLDQRGQK